MKKFKTILFSLIALCIIGYLYYYVTLPAINIHSAGFWWFIILFFIIISSLLVLKSSKTKKLSNGTLDLSFPGLKSSLFKVCAGITATLCIIFIFGSLFSSQIFNAKKYQSLLQLQEANFTDDIKQVSYNEIPILDKDSAQLIGSRKMGSMVEYISQFEIAGDYTQINYKDTPVRVSPLEYGSILKWFTNRSKGIPAYMKIDMATQDTELVKLVEGMKYTRSDHFGRNIHRYLRFKYPTYIFDNINFEIDEEGIPYWICPVKDFTIGLFGGETIKNVVIVNAITGEHINYKVKDVPTWIDRVYSAELLIRYYDYYGALQSGYWNSVLSQKGCLQTTDGYNYIAKDNDVWVYTGVTSVGGDESNVGFVLMNQRTAETKYYAISGAEEFSAMSSAEGKVQHLGYNATFPLLLNIAGEPTYFMALKDSGGLVKQYAMVNIQKYTIVATAESITECEKIYIQQLKTNNITSVDAATQPTAEGVITKIAEGVIDGNSHYYIVIEGNEGIYDVLVQDFIAIVKYNVGDHISFQYTEGMNTNLVTAIE